MNPPPNTFWPQCHQIIQGAETIKNYGQVTQVIGLVIEGIGPACAIGDICQHKKWREDDLCRSGRLPGS
jgi:flagellar biosynthesis/type III secretory pathway ATPase